MIIRLDHKREEVRGVVSYFFRTDEPVTWKAGQFGVYFLEHESVDREGPERHFTISTAPHEQFLCITTRVTESSFKRALDQLVAGDTMLLKDISGEFVVDDPSRRAVFIAGGIGITPFRSMLVDLAHRQQLGHVRLVYANRDTHLVFGDELSHLAQQHAGLNIEPVVAPAQIDETFVKNLIEQEKESDFYISGPHPMVVAVIDLLQSAGVETNQIKRDFFPGYAWPDA